MIKEFPVKPLGDRLVVKVIDPDTMTQGGILLPNNVTTSKMRFAEVVAVGRGVISNGQVFPLETKVGDIVQFQWTGMVPDEIQVGDQAYYMISERVVTSIWDPATTKKAVKGAVISETKR